MANYVKFLRGTPKAYDGLTIKDTDTLYFIADHGASKGELYLGEVLLASSIDEKEIGYTKAEVDSLLVEKANITDVYTKAQTDTAIKSQLATIDHLKRKIIGSYADLQEYVNKNTDAEHYIFMIPAQSQETNNQYDEYIVLGSAGNYIIELVGNWSVELDDYISKDELNDKLTLHYSKTEVDEFLKAYATTVYVSSELEKYCSIEQLTQLLSNYYSKAQIDIFLTDYCKKAEVDNLLIGKLDKVAGKDLVSIDEINKLITVKPNAEENFIKSVNTGVLDVINGQLDLKTISIQKVENLEVELNKRVNKVEYSVPVLDAEGNPTYDQEGNQVYELIEGALLSPEDKKKLNALVIDNGQVEISGKVNAENVEGLAEWITDKRAIIPGLLSIQQQEHLQAVEKNYINSVDSNIFEVTAERQLLLKEVPAHIVVGLPELNQTVKSLDAVINGYTDENNNKVQGIAERVKELSQQLKWQEMKE